MAILKSFKAWRPNPEFIKEVACVPYDVVSTKEALALAENKPNSFLHVIRPEIDLPDNIDIHADEVYQKGRENLGRLLASDFFTQEEEDTVYIYRLSWNGKTKTGIFSCVSVEDYDNDIILKHELTRPDKEDDRTKHIITQQAHAEPVMMTFESTPEIFQLVDSTVATQPVYDFVAEDGVQHTIWKSEESKAFEDAFLKVPNFYIADGHHRCASASRTAKEMIDSNANHTGREEYNFFPAVLFPISETRILPYNRIIYSLPEDFIDNLKSRFELTENADPNPSKKGEVSLYINGSWIGLTLPESKNQDVAAQLDIARLQEHILEPLLNITNQRTDENIYFIGGIRGTKELERLVDSGEAELAISMFATGIQELVDVSDAGQLMPPKSTWFEPKLRSGLLTHTF